MPICSVEGCTGLARAKGLCKNHYQRFKEYGRFDKIMTGEKTKHPLYWMWNKRIHTKNSLVEAWQDFKTFIKDVGEKPKDCFLARLDETKPCGPNNFEWRKIKVRKFSNETTKEYTKRAVAEARKLNPNLSRANNYKYNFGLSLEEVENKLKAQNYLCAMCNEAEKHTYKNTGKSKTLALDHCHKTGKIRDFLCSDCNLFVGKIEKDRNRVRLAEKYLDKWQ